MLFSFLNDLKIFSRETFLHVKERIYFLFFDLLRNIRFVILSYDAGTTTTLSLGRAPEVPTEAPSTQS